MDYKKVLLIINPAAGIKSSRYNVFDIIESFCQKGCITSTLTTLKAGDAVELVKRFAPEHDLVVCCGGDGTLNETVSALLDCGVNIPIGYIPCGSTNDMAKTLDIPTKVKKAANLIMKSEPAPFDVGKFGDFRYFCYTASFGAFTKISYSTPRKLKNILGHSAYILNGIAAAGEELVPTKAHIKADGYEFDGEFILGGIFNAKSVAGLVRLNKCDIELNDGKFELFLIRNPKNIDVLCKIISEINHQKFDDEHIIMRKVSNAEFTFTQPVAWSLDGEFGGEGLTASIKNLPSAVNIFKGDE